MDTRHTGKYTSLTYNTSYYRTSKIHRFPIINGFRCHGQFVVKSCLVKIIDRFCFYSHRIFYGSRNEFTTESLITGTGATHLMNTANHLLGKRWCVLLVCILFTRRVGHPPWCFGQNLSPSDKTYPKAIERA